jgi:uncharacterized membrane protein
VTAASNRKAAPRRLAALLLGALYLGAGILHLVRPEPFLAITPRWVPWPQAVIAGTGFFEIVAALALQSRKTRRWAGLGLALYALCVWPANWRHAIEGIAIAGLPASWWYHAPRLAAQPLLILAALYAGGWLHRGQATQRGST